LLVDFSFALGAAGAQVKFFGRRNKYQIVDSLTVFENGTVTSFTTTSMSLQTGVSRAEIGFQARQFIQAFVTGESQKHG